MPHPGGWGGFEGGDGEDGLINNVNGDFKDYPIEVIEVQIPGADPRVRLPSRLRRPRPFPRRVRHLPQFELEARAHPLPLVRALEDARLGTLRRRRAIGPEVAVNPGRDDERRMLKVNAHPMAAGSVVHMQTGGGGGFGNPRERDPERVRTDILDGFVTLEAARRDYGVIIDPETLEVVGLER